jgi:predicted dehydrogenase
MMKDLSIAQIGCGVISRQHLNAFKAIKGASIKAICDLSEQALEEVGNAFGIQRRTTKVDELLEDATIDAVILALPTSVRTPIALEALAAGKHVLLEKPAAMNLAEIDAMEAARGNLVVACCSARFSDYPSCRAAKEFLRSGKLGGVRAISCRAVLAPSKPPPVAPPPWRLKRALNGGGILVNWGSYDLDYLLRMVDFKVRPASVLARCWCVGESNVDYAAPDSDAETHVTALVRFDNGSVLDYERAEFLPIQREERWQIIGEKGTLELALLPAADKRILWNRAGTEGTEQIVVWEGDESHLDATTLVDQNFVAALRGECDPLTPLKFARVIQEVTDGIYQAASNPTPE